VRILTTQSLSESSEAKAVIVADGRSRLERAAFVVSDARFRRRARLKVQGFASIWT